MSCRSCAECQCQDGVVNPQRRSFLALAISALTAAIIWPRRAWATKLAIDLRYAPALTKVGGFAYLAVKGREILFVRDTATTIRALSPICTHKKFRVKYNPRSKRVECSEHESKFTLDGKVLNGPAKQDLSPVYWCELDQANNRILLRID